MSMQNLYKCALSGGCGDKTDYWSHPMGTTSAIESGKIRERQINGEDGRSHTLWRPNYSPGGTGSFSGMKEISGCDMDAYKNEMDSDAKQAMHKFCGGGINARLQPGDYGRQPAKTSARDGLKYNLTDGSEILQGGGRGYNWGSRDPGAGMMAADDSHNKGHLVTGRTI